MDINKVGYSIHWFWQREISRFRFRQWSLHPFRQIFRLAAALSGMPVWYILLTKIMLKNSNLLRLFWLQLLSVQGICMLSKNLFSNKNSEIACDRWIWTKFIQVRCQTKLDSLYFQTKTQPLIPLNITCWAKQVQHLKSGIEFYMIINFRLVLNDRHYIVGWITFNIDSGGTKKEKLFPAINILESCCWIKSSITTNQEWWNLTLTF